MKFIKIVSLNVRGLHNNVKRRALFLYLKNQKADFYCLQKTFSLKEDEVPWPSEWRGKRFSHESKSLKLKSRIDFFLIAQSLKSNIRTAEICSSIAPDHKAIHLSVEVNDAFHRGPGTWKFDNQLLEDKNYVQLITGCLPRILSKYQEVESHQLLWELIKMEFRSETISYSKAKRKEFKKRETYLQGKLDALDNEICRGNNHFNQQLLDEYECIKTELKERQRRQKAKKPCSVQKPAGLKKVRNPPIIFFNLEKRNFEKRVIAQLKLENGEIISDMKQIN